MTPDPRPSPALATFVAAIDRIEIILDQERRDLASLSSGALRDLSDRKARSLLEVSRAARGLTAADGAAVQTRLDAVREGLARNRAALLFHLNAARDISALVAQAIAEAESDGTYGASVGRGPRR